MVVSDKTSAANTSVTMSCTQTITTQCTVSVLELRPKKRIKSSIAKPRTGCITCKRRRVKCDEERPGCQRCLAFKVTCGGYLSPPKQIPRGENLALQSNHKSFLYHSPIPANTPRLTEHEARYFEYFIQDASHDFKSRNFFSLGHKGASSDGFFWNRLVLHESQHSESICHALLAVAALSKSLREGGRKSKAFQLDTGIEVALHDHDREFALVQYAKAVSQLRQSIVNPNHASDMRLFLITCLILATFDSFIGNRMFALRHIEYGRRALLSLKIDSCPTWHNWADYVEQRLIGMFMRLEFYAVGFLGAESSGPFTPHCLAKDSLKTLSLPDLSDSTSIKDFGNQHLYEVLDWIVRGFEYRFSPQDQIPRELLDLRDYFLGRYHLWNSQVFPILQQQSENWPDHLNPYLRPDSYKLYMLGSAIHIITALNAPLTVCDTLLEDFRYMLAKIREIIEFETRTNTIPPFTFEIRVIGALSMIATKCRDHDTRCEAISLLMSSHRRESMLDSFVAGHVGTWLMHLEEEGMDENGYIPEHARVYGEKIELDMLNRVGTVRCRRNLRDSPSGGYRELETMIRW